jgi:uncharacterized membrane protein YkoI
MVLPKSVFVLIIGPLMVLPTLTFLPEAEAGMHAPLHLARRNSENGGISLNEAVRRVQHDTGGRVLSAETQQQGGRTVHRIKVLTPSGHVRVYSIDAQTGAGR